MVAKLNYIFSPIPRNRSEGATTPVLNVDGRTIAKTTADLAASVQTDAIDASLFMAQDPQGGALARVSAIGGAVWLAFGTNPTAVAEANGAQWIPANQPMEFFLPNGWKIAAIDAA